MNEYYEDFCRHRWKWDSIVLDTNPPMTGATCVRCGERFFQGLLSNRVPPSMGPKP